MMVQKSPCQIGLKDYVPDENMMIICTTFICQSICVKISDWTFIICAISLCFMKKIEKGHLLGMRKLTYSAISSLNLFPRNRLKRLPISAFQSVSKYFDNMQFQP